MEINNKGKDFSEHFTLRMVKSHFPEKSAIFIEIRPHMENLKQNLLLECLVVCRIDGNKSQLTI